MFLSNGCRRKDSGKAYRSETARIERFPIVFRNSDCTKNGRAATCLKIAREIRGVVGIKEASGKIDQVREILAGAPEGFTVLSGDDDMTLEMMRSGAKGVISVASNIVPDKVSAMTAAALDGDFAKASAIDAQLQPLFKACFIESNPIPVKAALASLGFMKAEMRLPLTEAADATKAAISALVRNLKDEVSA